MDFPALADLDEQARRRLLRDSRRRTYARNEVVFHEGDVADAMYLLVAGHVSVRVTTPMGDTAILTVLGPGASFGELALLMAAPRRSATVVALDVVETIVLSADQVKRLRHDEPAMDRFLLSLLLSYVRRNDARLLEALYVPVEKRVLRRLVALARLYGDGAPGTVVPLTQEVLAGMAGSTRPTTNQVLRSAEQAGLVTVGRGTVRVDDPEGLLRRAR